MVVVTVDDCPPECPPEEAGQPAALLEVGEAVYGGRTAMLYRLCVYFWSRCTLSLSLVSRLGNR